MTLVELVVILAVIGIMLWLLNTQVPMDATIKKIINIVVVVAVVIWLFKAFGLLDSLGAVTV